MLLVEIESVGFYERVENRAGREVALREGSQVVVVAGSRGSGTSLLGSYPSDGVSLDQPVTLDLLAVGGVVGFCRDGPPGSGPPTKGRVIGAIVDAAGRFVGPRRRVASRALPDVPILLVAGTSAEVGKTTLLRSLINAGIALNLAPAAIKLTGTGRLRDLLTYSDAGAVRAVDFVDAGLATTYEQSSNDIRESARWAFSRAAGTGSSQAGIVLAELGGDIWDAGGPDILTDGALAERIRIIVVVGSDPLAAFGALTWLQQSGCGRPPVTVCTPRKSAGALRERLANRVATQVLDPASDQEIRNLIADAANVNLASRSTR